MRVDALDDLAELDAPPQHAVGGRMLRAEIDRVVGDVRRLVVGPGDRLLPDRRFGAEVRWLLDLVGLERRRRPGASGCAFSSPGRMYSAPSHGLRKSKLGSPATG